MLSTATPTAIPSIAPLLPHYVLYHLLQHLRCDTNCNTHTTATPTLPSKQTHRIYCDTRLQHPTTNLPSPHGGDALVDEVDVPGAVDEVQQERLPRRALQHHGHRARLHRQPPLLLVHPCVRVSNLFLRVERRNPARESKVFT